MLWGRLLYIHDWQPFQATITDVMMADILSNYRAGGFVLELVNYYNQCIASGFFLELGNAPSTLMYNVLTFSLDVDASLD